MRDIHDSLYGAALGYLNQRFPGGSTEGAAAMYTDKGNILISTSPDCLNDGVSLCHETGALCEAYKLDELVTASMCITIDGRGGILILSPCGICQERLFLYGGHVSVAVPCDEDCTKWVSRMLTELQPYYWRDVLPS